MSATSGARTAYLPHQTRSSTSGSGTANLPSASKELSRNCFLFVSKQGVPLVKLQPLISPQQTINATTNREPVVEQEPLTSLQQTSVPLVKQNRLSPSAKKLKREPLVEQEPFTLLQQTTSATSGPETAYLPSANKKRSPSLVSLAEQEPLTFPQETMSATSGAGTAYLPSSNKRFH
ncbi:unnamed protein product [Mytilus coruscus]|uniref:Uncharacterized protein n=1 Tax=Mytilus coruscus TaxID=42192 RepID=A0A6J8DQA4_MYTCO|nr:unnamed protein product [Mytilus coruscus]